jgi:hypothetical protein
MAESALGAVVVRIRAFDDMERPDAHEEASAVARVVSAVTTGVWPAASTPVEIDVHPGPLSYVSPVTGEGLAALFDLATREGLANPVGQILAESLLDEVFGDGPAMTLASPEGERLVSICRESLPDPARIATRLDEIARR